MKKICVVSDVIGNHDVIHNGENGFICKDVDIKTKYDTVVMAEEYAKINRGVQHELVFAVSFVVYKCVDITAGEAVAV